MYGASRTTTPTDPVERSAPLTLVAAAPAPPVERDPGAVDLRITAPLREFLDAAAASGLDADRAVELAIGRALALRDCESLAPDVETARERLNSAAAAARPRYPLSGQRATLVRTLTARRPIAALEVGERLRVFVPERLLVRARTALTTAVLRPGVVEEMIDWETAAAMEGRTMGEWALHALARRRG